MNTFNGKIYKNNKSGYSGVVYNKKHKKWHARINIKGKCVYLGAYENKEKAIKTRKEAELKHYGRYK
jgi:hypothetical protein